MDKDEFEEYFEEYQLPRSTALYSKTKDGRTYEVGAVARLNNNLRELPQDLREKLSAHLPIKNPFKSILARMTEVVLSLREVKLILERTPLRDPSVDFKPREGEAVGLTEAPRSILYHRYRTDSGGRVRFAKIVPPTSQNQRAMEEDVLVGLRNLKGEDVARISERLVRNFDPCISCASHFIEVLRDR